MHTSYYLYIDIFIIYTVFIDMFQLTAHLESPLLDPPCPILKGSIL